MQVKLNRILELKATLKGRNQKIKQLKKERKLAEEVYKGILEDYHKAASHLQKELAQTQDALTESKRKKWYQFIPIN